MATFIPENKDVRDTLQKGGIITGKLHASDNLAKKVIYRQSRDLPKMGQENGQNEIDAGATEINITLNTQTFILRGNGYGMSPEFILEGWSSVGDHFNANPDSIGKHGMGSKTTLPFGKTAIRSQGYLTVSDMGPVEETANMDFKIMADPLGDDKWTEVRCDFYLPNTAEEIERAVEALKESIFRPGLKLVINGEQVVFDLRDPVSFTDGGMKVTIGKNSAAMGSASRFYFQGMFVKCADSYKHPVMDKGIMLLVDGKDLPKLNFARNDILDGAENKKFLKLLDQVNAYCFREHNLSCNFSKAEDLRSLMKKDIIKAEEVKDNLRFVETLETGAFVSLKTIRAAGNQVIDMGSVPKKLRLTTADILKNQMGNVVFADLSGATYEILSMCGVKLIDAATLKEVQVQAEEEEAREKKVVNHKALPKYAQIYTRIVELANLAISKAISEPERELRFVEKLAYAACTDGKDYIKWNMSNYEARHNLLDAAQMAVDYILHEYAHNDDSEQVNQHGADFDARFRIYAEKPLMRKARWIVESASRKQLVDIELSITDMYDNLCDARRNMNV